MIPEAQLYAYVADDPLNNVDSSGNGPGDFLDISQQDASAFGVMAQIERARAEA